MLTACLLEMVSSLLEMEQLDLPARTIAALWIENKRLLCLTLFVGRFSHLKLYILVNNHIRCKLPN